MFELTIRQKIAVLVLLIFLVIGGVLLFVDNKSNYSQTMNSISPPDKIYVYVCGAVNKPGVINLKPSTRKFEAIQMAGGVLPEADLNRVNLAEFALDGEQIYIPKQGEVIKQSKGNKKVVQN